MIRHAFGSDLRHAVRLPEGPRANATRGVPYDGEGGEVLAGMARIRVAAARCLAVR